MTVHSTMLIDGTPALHVCRWVLRNGAPQAIGEAACSALAQSPEWTDQLIAREHRNAFWSKPDMAQIIDVSVPANKPSRSGGAALCIALGVAVALLLAVTLLPARAADVMGRGLGDVSGCVENGGCA